MRPIANAVGKGKRWQFLLYPTGPQITRAATSPDAPPVCGVLRVSSYAIRSELVRQRGWETTSAGCRH